MPKLLNKAQRQELMGSTAGSELLKRFDDQHSLVVAHKSSYAYKTKADMGEELKAARKKKPRGNQRAPLQVARRGVSDCRHEARRGD